MRDLYIISFFDFLFVDFKKSKIFLEFDSIGLALLPFIGYNITNKQTSKVYISISIFFYQEIYLLLFNLLVQ